MACIWYAIAKLKMMIDDKKIPGGGSSSLQSSPSRSSNVFGMTIGDVYAMSADSGTAAASGEEDDDEDECNGDAGEEDDE
jgi:hypothetical protein